MEYGHLLRPLRVTQKLNKQLTVVLPRPIHWPPNGLHGLTVLMDCMAWRNNWMAAQRWPRDLRQPVVWRTVSKFFFLRRRIFLVLMKLLNLSQFYALKQGWGTCCPQAKCVQRDHLIWLALEFTLPMLEHNIASKRSSMISRYLDVKRCRST